MAGHPAGTTPPQSRRYVLGAGRVYIARIGDDGVRGAERYVGSSPGFSVQVSTERTEVWDDDGPVAERVVDVVRQVAHEFSLQCKSVTADNVALFYAGDVAAQSDVAVAMAGDPDADPVLANAQDKLHLDAQDRWLKLGIYPVGTTTPARAAKPAGVRAISATPADTVVRVGAHDAAAKVAGTDYIVDAAHGRIYIPAGSTIAAGSTLYVTYTPESGAAIERVDYTEPRQIRGAIRYVEDSANKGIPAGNYGWEMYAPLCTIAASGEAPVKNREQPQTLGLTVAVQEPTSGPSITLLRQAA